MCRGIAGSPALIDIEEPTSIAQSIPGGDWSSCSMIIGVELYTLLHEKIRPSKGYIRAELSRE